jgi:hypothetical protein
VHRTLHFIGLHFDVVGIVSYNNNGYKLKSFGSFNQFLIVLCWVIIVRHTRIIFHNRSFFVVGVLSIMAIINISMQWCQRNILKAR